MPDCNATLTMAVTTECPKPVGKGYRNPCKCEGVVCNTMVHVTLHTIKCDNRGGFANHGHGNQEAHVEWRDDAPSATPHTPPLVSDEEVEAARIALSRTVRMERIYFSNPEIRQALEAAAKVRQEARK